MHSDRPAIGNGQVSEFCGELIDSDHKTILGLAKRFDLAVDDLLAAEPAGTSTDTYWFLGRYTAAQADIDFAPVRDAGHDRRCGRRRPITPWDNSTSAGRLRRSTT